MIEGVGGLTVFSEALILTSENLPRVISDCKKKKIT